VRLIAISDGIAVGFTFHLVLNELGNRIDVGLVNGLSRQQEEQGLSRAGLPVLQL